MAFDQAAIYGFAHLDWSLRDLNRDFGCVCFSLAVFTGFCTIFLHYRIPPNGAARFDKLVWWNAYFMLIGFVILILAATIARLIPDHRLLYYFVAGMGCGSLVASPDVALLLETSFGLNGDDFESLCIKFEVCYNIFSTIFYLTFCSGFLITNSAHTAYRVALYSSLLALTAPYTFVMVNYVLDESYIYVRDISDESEWSRMFHTA